MSGTPHSTAISADDITVSFVTRRGVLGQAKERFVAVDGVGLSVAVGETLGVLGESGSGKSTLARAIGWLNPPDRGTVTIGGRQVHVGEHPGWVRLAVQYVFQDPYGALDPTKDIATSLAEPMVVNRWKDREARRARTFELLDLVGLRESLATRRPGELSGGQRQRVAIARALAMKPSIVIADEPTSALDVSTRSEILNLFADLQEELGTSFIFISHDVATARHISHRIAVMYRGRIVEEGNADEIVDDPRHPYTQALISAVLVPDARIQRGRRRMPITRGDASSVGEGCAYVSRCPVALDECRTVQPTLTAVSLGRHVACLNDAARRGKDQPAARRVGFDEASESQPLTNR